LRFLDGSLLNQGGCLDHLYGLFDRGFLDNVGGHQRGDGPASGFLLNGPG
jgi:hypothetical protein